jgi:hypothetical protein
MKRARFRLALFMVGIFIPFMLAWNIYGNQMIKQDYFKTHEEATSTTYHSSTTSSTSSTKVTP